METAGRQRLVIDKRKVAPNIKPAKSGVPYPSISILIVSKIAESLGSSEETHFS